MLKHKNLIFLFLFCFPIFLFPQLPEIIQPKVLLKQENSVYGKLHSYGWGIGYIKGNNITAQKKQVIDISVYSIKHPKEVKVTNALFFVDAKSFIYGKLNNFFLLQGSFGTNTILNNKPYWGGVEVRRIFTIGSVLGFTKPIYLYVFDSNSHGYYDNIALEKYNPDTHNQYNIYGRGPFLKGFDKIKFHPGLFAKAGLNFEYGADETNVRAIETGIMINAFLKKIELMSIEKNDNIFLSFYLNFHIGYRTN